MPGIDYSIHAVTPAAAQKAAASAPQDDGFSFDDFLDIVNPLQHIPVVSAIYRSLTGDEIGEGEKIAGDTLYGGLLGLASSVADTVFKHATGNYLGDTVLSWLIGGDEEPKLAESAGEDADRQMPQIVAYNKAAALQDFVTIH